ncbi:MAG: hypothetical protein KDA30_16190, partial [Phycisphaerales bacterium]|nr:hypothetical protein [Phycisphaerales bacterium]
MQPKPEQRSPTPTPLWACLSVTWITSFGTAIGWSGVFFVTKEAHGFSKVDNLWLGVWMGAAYTLCAWFAGGLMGRQVGRGKRV